MAIGKNFSWTLAVGFVLVLLTAGVHGESSSLDYDNGAGNGLDIGLLIGGVACVVALVIVIALCVEKRVHVDSMDRGPPHWTRSLEFKQEYNGGLSSVSDGLNNLSPFHVIRDRLGMAMTDGARWDVGFTSGKHVFECVWPVKKNRGTNCSLGLATQEVPLKQQGRVTLVGHHSQSWGFDLGSRKMVHTNKRTGSFQKQFPDRFFMYVDMDGGKVGFGEDVKQLGNQALFYGYLVQGVKIDRNVPLYVMIGFCAPREEVQIYYVGTACPQGGFNLVPPEALTPAVVYASAAGQEPLAQIKVNPNAPPPPAYVEAKAAY